MKTLAMLVLLLAGISLPATSAFATSSHAVHGYTTKKGTYVKPHRQTNPNKTKRDNWSTKGNVNPYTGKAGTKSPQ